MNYPFGSNSKMDSHHHQNQNDFLFSFLTEERPATSPEFVDTFFFQHPMPDSFLHPDPMGRSATLRMSPEPSMRAPLASPTGPAAPSNFGAMPPYHLIKPMMLPYNSAAVPTLMPISKPSSSSSSVASGIFGAAYLEESHSTDATPESSDVEDDGRSRRKKRTKRILSEDISAEHNEQAKQFPQVLDSMRRKLLTESSDGVITETAAVAALINEFTKPSVSTKYSLPHECEMWLKRAAEDVNEQRAASKGSRKKKTVDYVANAAGEKTFVCHYCEDQNESKTFKTQEGLNLHVRNKHEKDKKWVCYAPGCSVAFVRQADLRMHLIRMHAPHRPYPCGVPFCLKSFAGVSELRRHVKVDHYKQVKEVCGNVLRLE